MRRPDGTAEASVEGVNPSLVSGERGARGPLLVAIGATLVATALSYLLPEAHAATWVGLWFLAAVYALILHHGDSETIQSYGLSLGGLFEPEALSKAKLARSALGALGWALGLALLIFPAFWLGY